MRNRKGCALHIMAAVGERVPSRIGSLAFGTGDIDCVYHIALPELVEAVKVACGEDSKWHKELDQMIRGRRLPDISDLVFDLII